MREVAVPDDGTAFLFLGRSGLHSLALVAVIPDNSSMRSCTDSANLKIYLKNVPRTVEAHEA